MPPSNSGNHNTARTVPWKVLLGSSPHLSMSFIVCLFFIWRWTGCEELWFSEHCSLHCCNSISTVLRSDEGVWRGRPEFWCPCDHPRRLVLCSQRILICFSLTWLISHTIELEKHQSCSSIGIFSFRFGHFSVSCTARWALICNSGLGVTQTADTCLGVKKNVTQAEAYRVHNGIRWGCANDRATRAGAIETHAWL